MARIDWKANGERFFEAGIDRGVLYVSGSPGVPWVGLIGVKNSASGGEAKPRYLDGVKISNHASPEEFEGTIEAYTYPTQFEQCDGTAKLQNGLRASQQRRKEFGMAYRTLIGNDVKGLDHSYKIHILYNVSAQPAERSYQTLGEDKEALTFSWDITTRATLVNGLAPTAHFEFDSRDVPVALFEELENILYGDSIRSASLPSPGELVFLFDSFEDLVYDAGDPFTPVFATYDAGSPSTPVTSTIDGGAL